MPLVFPILSKDMCAFPQALENYKAPTPPAECVVAPMTPQTLILPNSSSLHGRRHCEGLVDVIGKDGSNESKVGIIGSFDNFIHRLKPQNFLNRAKDLQQNSWTQHGCHSFTCLPHFKASVPCLPYLSLAAQNCTISQTFPE